MLLAAGWGAVPPAGVAALPLAWWWVRFVAGPCPDKAPVFGTCLRLCLMHPSAPAAPTPPAAHAPACSWWWCCCCCSRYS